MCWVQLTLRSTRRRKGSSFTLYGIQPAGAEVETEEQQQQQVAKRPVNRGGVFLLFFYLSCDHTLPAMTKWP
ncbi:unnamed protein product [Pleuronectes platessa]|uniref:Uncharacterized protein n=1 Tax=Pleuronectes platessa TaxID=8262 RepID=A0A9N7Y830_PLEPL|nr:unnamed protein product [Pleuronectes platessa]